MTVILNIITLLFIFCIVVFVHELGHYLLARANGVKVYEFSLGMGPRLLKKEKGGTIYSIKAIPIGGSVRLKGEDEAVGEHDEGENEVKDSLSDISPLRKISVLFAGGFMNFILGFILLIIGYIYMGTPISNIEQIDESSNFYAAGLRAEDKIQSVNYTEVKYWNDVISNINDENTTIVVNRNNEEIHIDSLSDKMYSIGIMFASGDNIVIDKVQEGTPAYIAGLKSEDIILKVNGLDVNDREEVINAIRGSNGNSVELIISRDYAERSIMIQPAFAGYYISARPEVSRNIAHVIPSAIDDFKTFFTVLGSFFKTAITGNATMDDVSGPVGLYLVVDEFRAYGIGSIIFLASLLSINLGIINLLPLPALDGGRILFCLIEMITRKKIPPEKEGIIHFIGFALLMLFSVYILINDIGRL